MTKEELLAKIEEKMSEVRYAEKDLIDAAIDFYDEIIERDKENGSTSTKAHEAVVKIRELKERMAEMDALDAEHYKTLLEEGE